MFAASLGAMISNQSTFDLLWPAPARATEVSLMVCSPFLRSSFSKTFTFFWSLPPSDRASFTTAPSISTLKATLSLFNAEYTRMPVPSKRRLTESPRLLLSPLEPPW